MSEYIYEKISRNGPIPICEVTEINHTDGDGAFVAQVNPTTMFLFFKYFPLEFCA